MFVFFLIMEIVMLGAFQLSHATGAKKIIGIMCRVFLVLFIIGYLGFVVSRWIITIRTKLTFPCSGKPAMPFAKRWAG